MDIDERIAQRFQIVEVNGRVVHESARFAIGGYFAAHDALFLVEFPIVLLEKRLQIVFRDVENAFDGAFGFPLADGARIGTLPQNKRKRAEDDGFSGSRFARDYGKTLLEIDFQLVNQRVMVNV